MALTMFLINQRLYPIPYEWSRLMKLIGVYIAFYVIGTWIMPSSSWIHILILLAVLPILWIVRFFSQDAADE